MLRLTFQRYPLLYWIGETFTVLVLYIGAFAWMGILALVAL
jgi:hypothetical protein